MANRRTELETVLTADDQASKAIDQVAKKAAKLEGESAELEITADAKKAERDIDGLLSKVDKLGSGTAAELLIASNALEIQTDIIKLTEKLDKLDAESPDVDVTIAGITQAQADLDRVLAKAKEIDATPVDINTRPAIKGVDDLGKSADSSKSVLANMVGNSVQDLGALGGVAGGAGVAIGQMGEYMADARASGEGFGSIIANFSKMALPIAAIAIGTQLITKELENQKKLKAWRADEVDKYAEAVGEAGDAVSALVDELTDAGKIEGLDIMGDGVKDLTGLLADGGITAKEWAEAISGGKEGVSDLARQLQNSNLSVDDQRKLLIAAAIASADYAKGSATAADQALVFGESQDEVAQATQEANDALEASADAHKAASDALLASVEAQRASVDSAFAARQAQADFNDTLAELPEKLAAAGSDALKTQLAYDELATSAGSVGDAAVQMAEDQAAANGTTLTAKQRADTWNTSLLGVAATLNGPQRQAVLDYIGNVNDIPPEKATEIAALINEGKLAEAEAALEDASRTREASVKADADTAAAQRELDRVANAEYWATIKAKVIPISGGTGSTPWFDSNGKPNGRAAGGPMVTSFGATAAPTAAMAGPTFTTTVGVPVGAPVINRTTIVNVPRGYRTLDAATAANRIERRSGRLFKGRGA